MQLRLVASDDPVLRQTAKAVKSPSQVADLAADILETMEAEAGVGLAAPQVGKSVRLCTVSVDGERMVLINPEITKRSEKLISWEEGCLSLPRLFGDVVRPAEITFRYTDLDGRTHVRAADKLLARVVQHELDHLDGILFPDRMEDLGALRTISEEEWESRKTDRRPEFMDEEM